MLLNIHFFCLSSTLDNAESLAYFQKTFLIVTYFAYSIGDSYARISCLFHDLPVRAFDHLIARISLLLGSYLQFRKD